VIPSNFVPVFSVPCRNCPRRIPLSVAILHGSEEAGYLCEVCIAKEAEDLILLQQELSQTNTINIDCLDEMPDECAMCLKPADGDMRLVKIDNRMGLIHADGACEADWIRKNRKLIGPKNEFKFKLR
jgi:hypothetical protein